MRIATAAAVWLGVTECRYDLTEAPKLTVTTLSAILTFCQRA